MLTLITALLLSSAGHAAASCPANTSQLIVCTSTPKKGDNTVASEIFDSITVCSGAQNYLVPEKKGQSEAQEAELIQRMGGASYSVKAEPFSFTLSFAQGLPSGLKAGGKLTLSHSALGEIGSGTYTCE